MQKNLGKEYDELQRVAFLKDNCDQVEEKGYMKRFTPEQVQQMKEELAEASIKINDIQIEKKEANKDFKFKLDPLQVERKILLEGIKKKAEYTKEICYKFVDTDEKMVGFYNSEGDLIESRPASPDELQGTIFQINRKTGTND